MCKELELESAKRRLKEAEYSRDCAIKQLILSDKEIDKWKKIIEELMEVNKNEGTAISCTTYR